MTTISIGVVDDHPLFREGVTHSLSEVDNFEVIAEGANSFDAMTIADVRKPDIMLLDVSMPGDGLNAIGEILASSPTTRIIMLTASEAVDTLKEAMRCGAKGYVLKGVGSRGLAEAIQIVMGDAIYVAPAMSAKVFEISQQNAGPTTEERLTMREREVMEFVAQGLSNKHIAIQLDLQEKTIKHHMTQILNKFGVSNRTEAALAWRDRH